MLKTKIDFHFETVDFVCPVCGNDDLLYNEMPYKCWRCNTVYSFDVMDLINSIHARYQYYKYKKENDAPSDY